MVLLTPRNLSIALIATLIASLSGCGTGSSLNIVAKVGERTISKAELLRRMAAVSPEHYVPDAPKFVGCIRREQEGAVVKVGQTEVLRECLQSYESLKIQALDSMISSYWLIGEAEARGLQRSSAKQTGDAELQRRAELATVNLRALIRRDARAVSDAEVLSYYRHHTRQFERQEVRGVYLIENLASPSAAMKAKRAVEAGASLTGTGLHENVERFSVPGQGYATKAGEEALFTAKPHVLSGPILLNEHYALFEVTSVRPPVRRSLGSVREQVRRELVRSHEQQKLAQFVMAWRTKWIGKTNCSPGYVVQRCRQFIGSRSLGDPHALS